MIRASDLLDQLSPKAKEKLITNQEQINQLYEVLNVTRLDKQNALVRRLVKKTQDGTLGQTTTEAEDKGEEESVDDAETDKVNFGDVTTTYNLADRAAEAAAKSPSILPYVLAAALGGTGLGAAAMALPYMLKTTPVVQSADTDTSMTIDFKEEPKS